LNKRSRKNYRTEDAEITEEFRDLESRSTFDRRIEDEHEHD
jgi:hypothetical protein